MNYLEMPYILGHTIKIDPDCLVYGGSFSTRDLLEPAFIERVFSLIEYKKDPILFDVGANSGAFSLLPYFKNDLSVYAFEPYDDVANLLRKNIVLNELENQVHVSDLALSNYTGKANLKCCYKGRSGMSTLGQNFDLNIDFVVKEVQVNTLDSFVEKHKIDRIDMIKIDAEGSDLFVLKGARESIERFHPVIVVEAVGDRTQYFNYSPSEIHKFLKNMNYNTFEFLHSDVIALK